MSAGLADVLLAINSDAPRDMWRQGVVTAITGTTVTVQIGTAATPVTGLQFFDGYAPRVGDAVHLLPYGSTFVVVGVLARDPFDLAYLTANATQNFVTTALANINGTVALNNGAGVPNTDLAISVAVVNGRRYKITFYLGVFSTVANDVAMAGLAVSGVAGNLIQQGNHRVPITTTSSVFGSTLIAYFYPNANGTAVFTARGARASGTGNVNFSLGSSISAEEMA